jgi:ATP-dependent protease ClpP protease subunit
MRTGEVQPDDSISLAEMVSQEVDEESRVVYFFEDIEMDLVRRIAPTLRYLADTDDGPITLECGSPGGADGAMFMLADIIASLGVPVHLKAYGSLCSAGTVFFAVCAERYVGANCEVLLHAFGVGLNGGEYSARTLADRLASCRLSAHRWALLLSTRTNPDVLSYDDLLAIALGDAPEQRLVGATLVSAGLADGVL